MTRTEIKKGKNYSSLIGMLVFTVFLTVLLFFASEIKNSLYEGIRLAVTSIVPSVFPFIIISDYLSSIEMDGSSKVSRFFGGLFGLPGVAMPTVVAGLLCGFPLGVKNAGMLYENGVIDKRDFLRISGYLNNPSLGFVLSAVGVSLRGNVWDGVLMFLSVTSASLLLLIFTAKKQTKCLYKPFKYEQKFDLSNSINCAASTLMLISSYVIFFSAVLGVLKIFIKSELLIALMSPLFEVGNAMNIISKSGTLRYNGAMAISAFALGFSGFSVHMQTLNFIPERAMFLDYLYKKTVLGTVSAMLMLFILFFV